MKNVSIVILLTLLLVGCGKAVNNEDADMNRDMASADVAPDLACEIILGYTVDYSIPCRKSEKPDVDYGCVPCSNGSCTGVTVAECFLSPDEKIIVFSRSRSAPYGDLLDQSWTNCLAKTGAPLAIQDLPVCL